MPRSPRRARRRTPAVFEPPAHERRDPTLYQKKNGFWYVRFRHDGRTKDVALEVRTPYLRAGEAPSASTASDYVREGKRWVPRRVHDRFVADYRTPYTRGQLNPWDRADAVLLADAVDEFLGGYEEGGHTHRGYKSILHRLKEAAGDPHVRLDRLTPEDIAAVVDAPAERVDEEGNVERRVAALSPSTRRSYRRHLRAFFNWALDRRYLQGENPVDALPEPRAEAKAKYVYCSPDDFAAVMDEVDADFDEKKKWLGEGAERHLWVKPVFELAVMTGLRRAELGQLQWQDVDLAMGTLVVREKTAERDGVAFVPKSRAARRVEVFPRAERVIKGLREASPDAGPHDFVLTSPQAGEDGAALPANVGKASARWREHRRKAGLSDDLKFHGLRHTFVTNLLLLGYAPFFVMAQAGHADIATTMQYAHFADALVSRRMRAAFRQGLVEFGYAFPEGVAVGESGGA